MIKDFCLKLAGFFVGLLIKNLQKIQIFAVLLLSIGIVTFAVYYSDNVIIDTEKRAKDDCETENKRLRGVIDTLYERLIPK